MKQYPGLAVALVVCPVLTLGLVSTLAARGPDTRSPVYAVAQVRVGLADQRAAWVERAVRVRGLAEACLAARGAAPALSCRRWPAFLVDPGQRTALPFTLGAANPLLAVVRRLPLVGHLAPPPQAVQWGAVAIYRVQLAAAPAGSCSAPPCAQALLLDAAP